MKGFAAVVMAAVAFMAGLGVAGAGEPDVVTRVDTILPAAYAATLRGLRMDNDGLRARLEGVEDREPEVIVRTVERVLPPDTVYRFVNVDSRGRLGIELLTRPDVPDSLGNELRAPALYTGIDISDCDDGWQVRDGEVLCDSSQLGHLYVGPWLSRRPSVAVWWTPSYRSPWEASVGFSGSWDFGLRRGVRAW